MNHRSTLPALGLGFLLAVAAWGQHHSMGANDYDDGPGGGDPNPSSGCTGVEAKVTIGGLAFSPATVTVDAGQPVCWTWSGAEHTVKADDGSFTSGPPASSVTFQRTFNTPGTYGYYCQVHGSASGGMRGTVVVRGGSGGEGAGTLALASTSYTVSEGIGALTVTVERTGGSDGAATVRFETASGSARSKKDFTSRSGSLSWSSGDQDPKTIEVPIKNDKAKEKDETFTLKLSRAIGAGLGASSATVTIHDDDSPGCGASLAAPAPLEARGQSDSEIRLAWAADPMTEIRIERRRPGGAFQEIASLPAGAQSFVDSGLPGGATFQYRVKAVGMDGVAAFSDVAAGATDGATTPCDDANALCLDGGRFEAMVEGRPGAAGVRQRTVLPEAPGAGLFSLSRTAEPQLLINLIDGCDVNGHHWLYFATVADVELTVKVRDTQTGRTWAWFNPAGSVPAPVRDVEAFSCQ
ncbi:MAG: Calx-beta domain-containing protein [Thermoanaerobaculia bacterium]